MSNKREPLNIALIDLNHMTVGVHTNTIPLGIGQIAHYLKNKVEHKFDIRIFKNPDIFLNSLKNWKPDVLGMAQYVWNSELNLYMAGLLKRNNPDCLVVAGGPNLYLSAEERLMYLKEKNFIDLCVSYDGEIPFAETIQRFVNGESIEDIKTNPPAGTYAINPVSDELVEAKESAPRLDSLDVFGPMYAEGFFNQLLDQGFHPFVQTHRGCPFGCAYCHTSDSYYSRMIFQSPECFRQDIEYLGKRFSGQHNVILHMANTNFGLFEEDFEIARIIREVQDKYDWPKIINVNSGKDPDKLLKMISILKYKFTPAIALQTLTPEVLKNIGRKNIKLEKFVSFQKKVVETISKNTATELILSLPEETRESFLKTISSVLNSGVQNIVIYTLMALRGTPLACREISKKYGHDIRYRIVPRCFSEINGVKIFEPEEVVVGTKTMPFEVYMSLRGLALIVTVFASSIGMFPIRKFLMEHKFDIMQWILGIYNNISEFPSLHSAYKSFLKETGDELFISQKALAEFFNKQNNYDSFCEGKLGDNLLRKYKTIFLSQYYEECLKAAFSRLRHMMEQHFVLKQFDLFVNDLELYLKSRDISHMFRNGYSRIKPYDVTLVYDIPRWLVSKQKDMPSESYKGKFSYSIVTTSYIHDRLKSFRQMNQASELSLQILYRDGYISDFWPKWNSNSVRDAKGEKKSLSKG